MNHGNLVIGGFSLPIHMNILPWMGKVLPSLLLVIFGAIFIRFARNSWHRLWQFFSERAHFSQEGAYMSERILRWFLWGLVLVALLNVWGINVTAFWTTLLGILTVIGVGFLATWAMISNIAAHFLLWIWRPFHLGQEIEIFPENLKGKVSGMNLMFTELRDGEGHGIILPNNFFFQKIIRIGPMPQKNGELSLQIPAQKFSGEKPAVHIPENPEPDLPSGR